MLLVFPKWKALAPVRAYAILDRPQPAGPHEPATMLLVGSVRGGAGGSLQDAHPDRP